MAGDEVKLHWGNKWWNDTIVEVDGQRVKVHYDGWGDSWDAWNIAEQLRWRDDSPLVPGGPADPHQAGPATKQAPTPKDRRADPGRWPLAAGGIG